MRVDHQNRYFCRPKEKRLIVMAKDDVLIYDVEEGEISDSASSIEEISEEDFRQESRVSRSKGGGGDSRVWMNFPVRRSNYGPDLYNLAWAQAVQNKPLNEIIGRDFGSNDQTQRLSSTENSEKDVCSVVIDDSGDEDKEEGELEEGEIELDYDGFVAKSDHQPEVPAASDSLPSDAAAETSGDDMELEKEVELEEKKVEKEIEIEENKVETESNEKSLKEIKEKDKENEFEKRINIISEALKLVSVKDAEKSFHGACLQLQSALESLQLLVVESRVAAADSLIEQTFTGILVLDTVFGLSSLDERERNGDEFSSLLAIAKRQDPVLFSAEQMNEVERMMQSLSTFKEKEISAIRVSDNKINDLNSLKKISFDPVLVNSGGSNFEHSRYVAMKPEQPFRWRNRLEFGPLIDLHAEYDEGSLPSPTRENPPPLLLQKPHYAVEPLIPSLTAAKQEETEECVQRKGEVEDDVLHPYVTDALRAVSSYQQKFGRTSFLSSNRLPSPTPSAEDDDDAGADSQGEISSSTVSNARTVNSNVILQPPASTTSQTVGQTDGLCGQGSSTGKTAGSLVSGSIPGSRSVKSRDPRLRFANLLGGETDVSKGSQAVDKNTLNSDILGGRTSSGKHKVDECLLDGQTLKRQRSNKQGAGTSKALGVMSGSGAWLEVGGALGHELGLKEKIPENMAIDLQKSDNGNVGCDRMNETHSNFNSTGGSPVSGDVPAVSLPSLLEDIAVNQTMLMNLIKMEQARLNAESQHKSPSTAQLTSLSSSSGALSGLVSSGSSASSKPSSLYQRPLEKLQSPFQSDAVNSQSERAKVRMKPRDPRRVLHNNLAQKNESSISDQFKPSQFTSNALVGKEGATVGEQGEQAVTSLLPQSNPLPDIAPQFTKKLKNIADLLCKTTQTTTGPTSVPQNIVKPVPASKTEKMDVRVPCDSNDEENRTTHEEVSVASSQPPNPWGDVEHLFEGYDEQQKAAIQKERARRIEEQNKMFAARKLCLVLDLDHTLLNSAKFVEVEKVHDEILRKKEELDREKPQRHLFRFSHMGMWTKLRPGIWNFLEKASKLYELHLYTMGNKFYATEMAKVLDPTGALFAGRVISRGDDGDPFDGDERLPKSKDLDGVLGMESAVVIIDDSVRVWPHNKLNLILVERYTYFPCSRRQFGLVGPSLLEIDHDERPEDGTLASSLAVIERIHQIFFSHRSLNEVDVRNVLAAEQRKILAGCRIVFSRIFPVGEANPHLHPLWQTAEQFGAMCTNQIDDQVTHVVAISPGTDKVNWALSTGRFVVHPGWVEASALLYRRVNERDFAVKI